MITTLTTPVARLGPGACLHLRVNGRDEIYPQDKLELAVAMVTEYARDFIVRNSVLTGMRAHLRTEAVFRDKALLDEWNRCYEFLSYRGVALMYPDGSVTLRRRAP